MLTIPNSVKTLYQTDEVRKNFRVHFPNGEYNDITNSDVVSESVHFTESLCSQSVFKFGLAEASVLEFETVGIGNMYGMTIEASIEIDTSSLSAAQILSVKNNQGDGTLVEVANSDIGYGFYRIPLGTFRVDSCPRNHGAMAHRKVTAYSLTTMNLSKIRSEFEKGMADAWQDYTKRKIDLMPWLISRIGYLDPQYMTDNFTKSVLFNQGSMNTQDFGQAWTGNSVVNGEFVGTHRLKMTLYRWLTPSYTTAIDELWAVDVGDFDYAGAAAFIQSAKETYGDLIDKMMNPQQYFSQVASAEGAVDNGVPSYEIGRPTGVMLHSDVNVVYPYNSYQYTTDASIFGNGKFYFRFPSYIKLELYDGNTLIDSFESTATSPPVVYKYTPNTALPSFPALVDPVESFDYVSSGYNRQANRYDYFSGDFVQAFSSTLELMAEFAKEKRGGGLDFIHLDDSSPVTILPANYEEMWWDEYDVSPIGTVSITFTDGEETGEADITVGNGYSNYDMADNVLIKSLANNSQSYVTSLINSYFKPYIGDVVFTPTELTMQGWPWLEAGDALQITAEDGTVVDTYALRIEMSGIQHLQMSIVSEGGEIIEEEP